MLWSAVILGFLGSLHCVGMCGPIAFVLPLDRDKPVRKFIQIMLYHFGRILTYGMLGLLFGLAGRGLFVSGLQQRLSVIIGILMILAVLIPLGNRYKSKMLGPLYSLIGQVKQQLGKRLHKRSFTSLFTLGLLNGLLPCGLVYMALFGAIGLGHAAESSLYMALFGLGTIPLMSGAAYMGNFVSVKTRQRFQKAIPVFVVIIGIFFILRGMGLGIPYVSPSDMHLMVKAGPDCVVP
ncbi:sulfite exporter TauE/SafE family protein [Robertkochia aurantiaca]|uniref:sulfite exporter TauE/SafE family protein n=1 Tax=Robertkochia aurantiaca TaxID=2873700 RepID=UPI001CCD4E4B|nr:sulfite exporter TauE/SafE family protein [Robertkochia sp. 3YJGBD-33]